MSNDDKWFLFILFGLLFLFIVAIVEGSKYEEEFVEKCHAAGGVPSKYYTMVGKTHRTERACLHPRAIINME